MTNKDQKECCADNGNIMHSVAIFLSLAALVVGGIALGKSMQDADSEMAPTEKDKTVEDRGEDAVEALSSDDDFYVQWKAALKTYEEEMLAAQEEASRPQQVDVNVSVDDDPMKGDPNAPVTIVEFSEYECPYCARHFTDVYPQIMEKYIETGKAKYVFRDFPLDFHANAIPAAVAANCALAQGGDDAYYAMHDQLFSDQQNLNKEAFMIYAGNIGLDAAAFESCYDAQDITEITKDMQDGQSYGVSGTPGFFIFKEGEKPYFIKGAFPFSAFEQIMTDLGQ